jgi:GAF domain-containing protein
MLLTGESVLINRTLDEPGPALFRFGDIAKPSASLLFAPTRANGQVVGVISVQSYSPQRFGESDRRLLQRLADAVGPSLQRCLAERRSAAFAALGYRLSTAASPQDAARVIMDTADELLGWNSCSVYLYDADTEMSVNLLHMDIIDGQRSVVQPYNVYGAPGILAQKTIQEGPQLIVRDVAEFDPTQAAPFGDETRASASLMFVPLRVGERITGILSIQSYQRFAYDEADLALLQALADHCSGALERFRFQQALGKGEEAKKPKAPRKPARRTA